MNSVYFALFCLAIVYVIFWSVRNDGLPPDKIGGLFAMRRSDDDQNRLQKRERRIR